MTRSFHSIKQQRGLAMMMLIVMLGLIATSIVITSLNNGSLVVNNLVNTNQALAIAKENLKSYVLAGGSSGTSAGVFPCSENITSIGTLNEGQATGSCSNTAIIQGRLAWRTLGSGELIDGNSDQLWYALSPGFRSAPINSDSVAGFSVDGVANKAIAVIFSPGKAITSLDQTRPIPTSNEPPVLSNYLDGENADNDSDFITTPVSSTFNDKLITIEPNDIFPSIEKRVLGDIKNYLLKYKATWGAFPFPAPFSDPSSSTYVGSALTTGGLLPLGDAVLSWGTGSTCSSTRASTGVTTNGTMTISGNTMTCRITGQNYTGARTIQASANVNNLALGFYLAMSASSTLDFTFTPTATRSVSTITHTLNGNGGGTVSIIATPTTSRNTYTIVFRRLPQHDDWSNSSDLSTQIPSYVYNNNWHNFIYYKVATPFLPGRSGVCNSECLTINKTINSQANITRQTDVHALLLSAGRKLNATELFPSPTYNVSNPAQVRPSANLSNYFDTANNVSGGVVFDSKQLPLDQFNDQVLAVE